MIYNNIYDTIGNTPVVKLKTDENSAEIYAKLEYFNAGGSVKDRVARQMIFDLLEKGEINENTTLVEPTSGNTGIGLAMICASLGLKFAAVMPETMSIERRKLLAAYGAEIILTEGAKGMNGAIAKAEQMVSEQGAFCLGQFANPSNPQAHKNTTAKEIIADFDDLDAFVCGIGTGGTVIGNGSVLKAHFENITIVGVEPSASPFLSKGEKGPHAIQGIGAGFRPEILDLENDIIDEIITVTNEDALSYARNAGIKHGILLGISGGAAYKAATEVAKKLGKGKKVLFLAPDNGERYLSTALYEG
ncbi:MAG: cysteine synthase A [Clostridia bacterium]